MKYEYLAQDEYDQLETMWEEDGKKIKDPVEIIIKITIDKKRYESVKNRYKTPISQKIKDFFKPAK